MVRISHTAAELIQTSLLASESVFLARSLNRRSPVQHQIKTWVSSSRRMAKTGAIPTSYLSAYQRFNSSRGNGAKKESSSR
ncbi:MAG: hypothetical protein ACKO3O_02325, partial [Gammaproteobacteria bacterium]